MSFISSPQFLGWVALATFFWFAFKVLQKNVRWLPRGITGTATVARLQSGLTGLLPKSTLGWTLLIGVIAALFVLWMFGVLPTPTEWKGSWETPSLRAFTDFVWDHWLPIVILWGILAGMVAVASNTCAIEKITATTLHRIFAWVMGITFFALPAFLLLTEPSTAGTKTTKHVLVVPPRGQSEHIPSRPGYRAVFTGVGFKPYVVYRDGRVCSENCPDGPILELYVEDTTGRTNRVSYDFVRP
jgi:hypothetical protein